MLLTAVVCERCGKQDKAPQKEVWPMCCIQCGGDMAPRWWFRERQLRCKEVNHGSSQV